MNVKVIWRMEVPIEYFNFLDFFREHESDYGSSATDKWIDGALISWNWPDRTIWRIPGEAVVLCIGQVDDRAGHSGILNWIFKNGKIPPGREGLALAYLAANAELLSFLGRYDVLWGVDHALRCPCYSEKRKGKPDLVTNTRITASLSTRGDQRFRMSWTPWTEDLPANNPKFLFLQNI